MEQETRTGTVDSTGKPSPMGEDQSELLAWYARRWEPEVCSKELKVARRSTAYLQSHTPWTASPEIAALILA